MRVRKVLRRRPAGPELVKPLRVEVGDDRVAGHVGLHLMSAFCEQIGLAGALASAIWPKKPFGFFIQDRGRILAHMAVVLAGGGTCLSDMDVLRDQPFLFPDGLASESTVARMFNDDIGSSDWSRIYTQLAAVRARVWDRYGLTPAAVCLDLDATLCNVESENKQGAAPTYKSGYGFAPMICYLDRDGTAEAMSGMFRPGNAGANTIADQVCVIDDAIGQLPAEYRAGHGPGGDAGSVTHQIVVRADAGSDTAVLAKLTDRNLKFLVSGAICPQLVDALGKVVEADWRPAVPSADHHRACDNRDGDVNVSAVVEVTDLASEIGHLPAGTRVILRRELLHPGAKLRLWDIGGWRYQTVYTNLDGDAVELEYQHRLRARCEQQMAIFKDVGGTSWPLTSFQGNTNWFHTVLLAQTLLSWVGHAGFSTELTKARPKKLRYRILSAPARVIRKGRQDILRLPKSWTWTSEILGAYDRLGIT